MSETSAVAWGARTFVHFYSLITTAPFGGSLCSFRRVCDAPECRGFLSGLAAEVRHWAAPLRSCSGCSGCSGCREEQFSTRATERGDARFTYVRRAAHASPQVGCL